MGPGPGFLVGWVDATTAAALIATQQRQYFGKGSEEKRRLTARPPHVRRMNGCLATDQTLPFRFAAAAQQPVPTAAGTSM
jgi:hypothetical protein